MSDLSPGVVLVFMAVLVASLSFHELAHAWTASRLGDQTARHEGRVTLNPAAHVDPIGTLLFPLVAIVSGFPLIGWAKPVPVVPRNLRNPRRDMILVAAAGPASNVLLAGLVWLGYQAMAGSAASGLSLERPVLLVVVAALNVNIALAVFNMLPIPPLDGGNVLSNLLPARQSYAFDRLMRPYGFVFLYVLMLTGVLRMIMVPPMRFFQSLFAL